MTLWPGGKPNTNALLSIGPAQAPWLEVGYPQMPDAGFWDWFLRDQPMIERMQQGLTPTAQEPPPGPLQGPVPAPGPPRMLYAEGATGQPQAGPGAFPGEPPAPIDPAFLGLGQPSAGAPSGMSPMGDAVASPATTMFGQSLGGQGPSPDNDWLSATGDWLAEQAGIVGRGAMGLGEAWMEHAVNDWDPTLRFFGVDPRDPLGLAPESATAAQGLSPLQEEFARRMAAGGGERPGAQNRPAGPGGTGPGAGVGGGGSGGGGMSYSLGRYQAPPPVPTRALPNAPDLSGVMSEIEASAPRRPEDEEPDLMGRLALGTQNMLRLGPRASVGEMLLALGGGIAAGVGQEEREAEREQRYYEEQEREHRLRIADAKLKGVEIGAEYEQKRADIDYENRLGEWKREAAILEAHQPQAQMTGAGLLIQDIGPDGERRIRIDNRPVQELLEMRTALKGLGAGQNTVNQFTRQQLNPDSPEDLAFSWALDLMDSPDLWPVVYGDKFGQFNQEINSIIGQKDATGQPTAFGAYASNLTGTQGNAMQGQLAQRALARKLWMDMMNNPDIQKRYLALQAGQAPGAVP